MSTLSIGSSEGVIGSSAGAIGNSTLPIGSLEQAIGSFAGAIPSGNDGAQAMNQTSNNSNGVGTLSQSADSNYNQTQVQEVMNKLDELINALRRNP